MTISELQRELNAPKPPQVIDVRSPGEFAAGHIPGAANVPLEQIPARTADLRTDVPVALVCQSGRRAGLCAEMLKDSPYQFAVVEGGTTAWHAAGLPLVRTTRSGWSIERQVRLAAGVLVLLGTVLAVTVSPGAIYLSMFVGAGLTFAGLTNICGMASLFARLPWNRPMVSEKKS